MMVHLQVNHQIQCIELEALNSIAHKQLVIQADTVGMVL
jgi:hypothetical protein